MPEPTAQPAIEDEEKTQKLRGAGAKQPCGRVVGIIRRHWREKSYCGSLRQEGDRAVTTGKGQTTSALFVPVDGKVSRYYGTQSTSIYNLFVSVPCRKGRRTSERLFCAYPPLHDDLLFMHRGCLQIPWVRIQTRQRDVLSSQRILVAMDSWPAWCKYPLGHYVKTLGEKGAKATETEVSASPNQMVPRLLDMVASDNAR